MFIPIVEVPEATHLIEIELDGKKVQVDKGISVAAAALGNGQKFTRTTPVSGSKRAPYCMMGVCYDCIMVIDGKANQRACSIQVRPGMKVEVQQGVGSELIGPDIGDNAK